MLKQIIIKGFAGASVHVCVLDKVGTTYIGTERELARESKRERKRKLVYDS